MANLCIMSTLLAILAATRLVRVVSDLVKPGIHDALSVWPSPLTTCRQEKVLADLVDGEVWAEVWGWLAVVENAHVGPLLGHGCKVNIPLLRLKENKKRKRFYSATEWRLVGHTARRNDNR